MKRLLYAIIGLLALCGAANAQGCGSSNPNCILPDRPLGDNTSAGANTKFVQQNLAASGGVFTGPNTTNVSNAYSVTVAAGFALAPNVSVIIGINADNTAAATLSVNGTDAKPINRCSTDGCTRLNGGELVGGIRYLFVYDSTVWELRTSVKGDVEVQTGNYAAAQHDFNGDFYVFTGASPTLTLPAANTIPNNGYIEIFAQGGNVTAALASGTDIINNGSAGASLIINVGNFTKITTDGVGHWYIPNPSGGSSTLAHTHIFVGNSSNIATDFGSLATFSDNGTLAIIPTANSTNRAFNTSQTTPTAATPIAGPQDLNLFSITLSPPISGTGNDSFGLLNDAAHGFRFNSTIDGVNLGSNVYTGFLTATLVGGSSNPGGDRVGTAATIYTNSNVSNSILYGLNSFAFVDSSGNAAGAIGFESDVQMNSGATLANRFGVKVTNGGNAQASTLDTAFGVSNVTAGGAGGSFKKLISLAKNIDGAAPLSTSADFFFSDASATVANIFNLSNVTVTGNIWNFPNTIMTGAGVLAVGTNTAPSAPIVIQGTGASEGTAQLEVSANTTTGWDGFETFTSAGAAANDLFMAANEANRTATLFGITTGNWTEIVSSGASNNGLLLGTATAKPIVIGTNGTEIARFTGNNLSFSISSGGIVGTTTNDNAAAGNVGEYIAAECTSNTATVTITIASPAVITWTAHGYSNTGGRADACPVNFTTTGALPTGITAGTNYWIIPSTITTNTFEIATSIANALAGTPVNTSGSQSGTQTGVGGVLAGAGGGTKSITGISLTAGDWDVEANGCNNLASGVTMTAFYMAISKTVDSIETTPNNGLSAQTGISAVPGFAPCAATRLVRESLSGTTTIFSTHISSYSGGSNNDNVLGGLVARRRR